MRASVFCFLPALKQDRSLTLREALERYRDEKTIHKATKPVPGRKGIASPRWLEHPLAAKMLHQIVAGDLEKYRDERLASGKAFATVRHELNIISQVYEAARFSWRMRDLNNPREARRREKPGADPEDPDEYSVRGPPSVPAARKGGIRNSAG